MTLQGIDLDDGSFMDVQSLEEFRTGESRRRDISDADRVALVSEARSLFFNFYAHLDLKEAMLAVDPVGECDMLLREIERRREGPTDHYCDIDFFHDLLGIFVGLRDAHTSFTLPEKYSGLFAHLPFTVEEYYIEGDLEPRTRVLSVAPHEKFGHFQPGVEIVSWNSLPICRKLSDVANLAPGATRMARRRMAAQMLTTRWLGQMTMPEENAVAIEYYSLDPSVKKPLRHYFDWRIYTRPKGKTYVAGSPTTKPLAGASFFHGVNRQALELQRARYRMFKRQKHKARESQACAKSETYNPIKEMIEIPTGLDNVTAGIVKAWPDDSVRIGHLRIHNFDCGDPVKFTHQIAKVLRHKDMPKERLIIDIRTNPGGILQAGELLLQLFTKEKVKPATLRFRSTNGTKELAWKVDILERWRMSLDRASETGSEYSAGFAATTDEQFRKVPKGIYPGEVILIIDAMTYSTADFFAAGFRDNNLGTIVGIDHVTGAGASTRWEHDQLMQQFDQDKNPPLKPFPLAIRDAQMSVAVQCGTRADGLYRDMPFEGMGVEVDSDCTHYLTETDLICDGADLICFVTGMFKG